PGPGRAEEEAPGGGLDSDRRVGEARGAVDAEDRGLLGLDREVPRETADGVHRPIGDLRHIAYDAEEGEEDRHLHEQRKAGRPWARLVVAEQRHLLLGHRLARVLVLLTLVL